MNQPVEPALLDAMAAHTALADALAGPGWGVVPDYLPREQCHALLAELDARENRGELRPAAIGRGENQQLQHRIRRSRLAWLNGTSPAQGEWLARMADLRQALNRHLMLGLRAEESFFAVYDPGDFYRLHWDNFRDGDPRAVTAVLFLNPGWQPEWGGQLRLFHPDGITPLAEVQPEAGTLAFFLSRAFPHEVLPASQRRVSLPTWFRNDRPDIPVAL